MRRYGSEKCFTYDISAGRHLPEWKKVMSTDKNKGALTDFLCKFIESNASSIELNDKKIYWRRIHESIKNNNYK